MSCRTPNGTYSHPYEPGYRYKDSVGTMWTVTNGGWPGFTYVQRRNFVNDEGEYPERDTFEDWLRDIEDEDGNKPFAFVYWEDIMQRIPVRTNRD